MPGRRPKPTVLHKLQGTYHATDHGRDRALEARAEGPLRTTPSGMTPSQRLAWRYAIRHAPQGVLFAIDREVLRLWVETLDRKQEAQRRLEHAETPAAWLAYHQLLNRTTVVLVRLAAELGFSPAARPRIHLDPAQPSDDEGNPWASLRLVQS
jgi:phage terminase small subunit